MRLGRMMSGTTRSKTVSDGGRESGRVPDRPLVRVEHLLCTCVNWAGVSFMHMATFMALECTPTVHSRCNT